MGYMVPLRFIPVGIKRSDNRQSDVGICATRIVAVMDYDIAQARKTVQAERKAGTLINASGQAPTRSVIFLDNGTVVASPLRVKRILSLIEKSDSKTGSVQEKRFRVYDVYNDKESEPDDSEKETDVEPEELAEDEAYEDYENFEYDD